jgi:hypothetical protein
MSLQVQPSTCVRSKALKVQKKREKYSDLEIGLSSQRGGEMNPKIPKHYGLGLRSGLPIVETPHTGPPALGVLSWF